MRRSGMLLAAAAGNFLEFYNFTIYAFFGPMLAAAFFPSSNHLTALLDALLAFALGFLTRPLGAAVMGRFERIYGRRAALQCSFGLMGAAAAMIAATPSYHAIGLAAPALVICARLLQGFSEGGEVGPATTLLLDLAPADRRAQFVMLQPLTQILAALAAVIAGALVSALFAHGALYAWGWRLPFFAGVAIVPIGLRLRQRITDPAAATEIRVAGADGAALAPRGWLRPAVLTMVFLSAGTVVNYVHLFGVSYAITVLHLSPLTGMLSMAAGLLGALVAMPLGLRLGRWMMPRRLIIFTAGIGLALTYPAYAYAVIRPGLLSQILLNLLVTGFSALPTGFVMLAALEALPAQGRSMQFGLIYALAISLFGGATQPALTWLIRATADPFAPCWVLLAASLAGLWAVLQLCSEPRLAASTRGAAARRPV